MLKKQTGKTCGQHSLKSKQLSRDNPTSVFLGLNYHGNHFLERWGVPKLTHSGSGGRKIYNVNVMNHSVAERIFTCHKRNVTHILHKILKTDRNYQQVHQIHQLLFLVDLVDLADLLADPLF